MSDEIRNIKTIADKLNPGSSGFEFIANIKQISKINAELSIYLNSLMKSEEGTIRDQIEQCNSETVKLQSQIDEIIKSSKELDVSESKRNEKEQEKNKIEKEFNELKNSIDNAQQTIEKSRDAIEELNQKIPSATQKINELKNKQQALETEEKSLKIEIDKLVPVIRTKEDSCNKLKDEKNSFEKRIEEINIEIAFVLEEIETLRNKTIPELENERDTLKSDKEKLENKIKSINEQLSSFEYPYKQLKENWDKHYKENEKLFGEIGDINDDGIKTKIKEFETRIKDALKEMDKELKNIFEIKEKILLEKTVKSEDSEKS